MMCLQDPTVEIPFVEVNSLTVCEDNVFPFFNYLSSERLLPSFVSIICPILSATFDFFLNNSLNSHSTDEYSLNSRIFSNNYFIVLPSIHNMLCVCGFWN